MKIFIHNLLFIFFKNIKYNKKAKYIYMKNKKHTIFSLTFMQYYELQARIFSKLLIFRHKWIRYFFHITILQIKSCIN